MQKTMNSPETENTTAISGLKSLGFRNEGTGGGCTALIRRLANSLAIYLTDGDLSAPATDSDPCELAIYDDNSEGTVYYGMREFPKTSDALAFFTALAMQDAMRILEGVTSEQLAYASSENRGEYRGFSALHDLMDANELLPNCESASEEFDTNRAANAMNSFNELIGGADHMNAKDASIALSAVKLR
jgi:hypothetical protein